MGGGEAPGQKGGPGFGDAGSRPEGGEANRPHAVVRRGLVPRGNPGADGAGGRRRGRRAVLREPAGAGGA